jgi:cytochrome P450
VRIAKNTVVDLLLASAHRDPEVFERPLAFDVQRDPNPHFAFGGGIHYCLGAHLARLEARAAFGALVKRTRDLQLTTEAVSWGPSVFRVPASLPITFVAR